MTTVLTPPEGDLVALLSLGPRPHECECFPRESLCQTHCWQPTGMGPAAGSGQGQQHCREWDTTQQSGDAQGCGAFPCHPLEEEQ